MKVKLYLIFLIILPFHGAFSQESNLEVLILGAAQDGGYPQAGCKKTCCKDVIDQKTEGSFIVSIAIIDKETNNVWLVDCTPDFSQQMRLVSTYMNERDFTLDGIFLTHAHIGHYLGLSQLGREVMGTHSIPAYAMPKMREFIKHNGPWNQLVDLRNIELRDLNEGEPVGLIDGLSVTPFLVPHRDEYSETVGYYIRTKDKSLLYIPDIDKWTRWDRDLSEEIQQVDYALIDATFYSKDELPGRNLEDIPHPTVIESMELLQGLSPDERKKVHFIHMNHSNPILRESDERNRVLNSGFNIGKQGKVLEL